MEKQEKPKSKPTKNLSVPKENNLFGIHLTNEEKTVQLYRENKLIFPLKDFDQLPKRKGIDSHIFDQNSPNEEPVKQKRKIRLVKDSINSIDDYVDTSKTNRFQKKHIQPQNFVLDKKKSNFKYYDELRDNPNKNKNLDRRIKDNYGSNPIAMLNKEQKDKMNEKYQNIIKLKSKMGYNYLNSDEIKKTFRNFKKENVENNIDKITNVPTSKLTAAIERKKDEPNFSKIGFRKIILAKNRLNYGNDE